MRRVLDFLYDAAGYLAAFFVFALFAVMIGASVMRELGFATGGSDDIVSWLCAAAAFFGMAHTFKRGDFVRVTLLLESLGPRARHAFEVVSLAIAAVFTALPRSGRRSASSTRAGTSATWRTGSS